MSRSHQDLISQISLQSWSQTLVSHNQKGAKIAIYLVISLYPVFGVLDYFVMSKSVLIYSYTSRLTVVMLSVAMLFLLRRPRFFVHIEAVTALYMYVVGLGICFMVWMMSGLASSYYAGLTLVMIGSALLYAWSPRKCLLLHGGLWLTWLIPSVILHPVEPWSQCVTHFLFLSATTIIATVGQIMNYRRLRQEYETRRNLSSAQTQLNAMYHFNHIGRYKLFDLLGEGGYGQVYMAYDAQLKAKRALKIINLPPSLSPEQARETVERMIQAARTTQELSQLTHNVVQVFDIQLILDQPPLYIVMELLEGATLKERLKRRDLSVSQLLQVADLLLETMAVAHRRGVVHRDLKPENIMITSARHQEVSIKVFDFDLVKVQYSDVLTREGQILGTLEYMAPEQLKGLPVDPRTDVFSIAAILYECFSGVRANPGATQRELVYTLLVSGVRPLREVAPHLPSDLCQLIDQCLDVEMDRRLTHAGELYDRLQAIKPQLSDLKTSTSPYTASEL